MRLRLVSDLKRSETPTRHRTKSISVVDYSLQVVVATTQGYAVSSYMTYIGSGRKGFVRRH